MTGKARGRKNKPKGKHSEKVIGPGTEEKTTGLSSRDGLPGRTVLFLLFFTSGFTGLVYEVLWMKELGLLFGSTAYAAATTLCSFFLGLAAGGYLWGRRAGMIKNPLRWYGLLEAGVALSAFLYFFLLHIYRGIYGPLYQIFGGIPLLFLVLKFLLGVILLFPPAFFMGGTLPMMSQHLVRREDTLGRTASALYSVNTFGAALGAYMAGFHLPPLIGFNPSYYLAIAITGAVAVAALILSFGKEIQPAPGPPATETSELPVGKLSPRAVQIVAFLSGFVTLGLEVLWTRMFAQVLQNSVYTFSAILVVFLICLALGAGLANVITRRQIGPRGVLTVLVVAAALSIPASTFIFNSITDGLSYLGGGLGWYRYIIRVFTVTGMVLFLPCLLLGTIFPYLMKVSEPFRLGAGRTVGNLIAINMVGAIAGSLTAGFIFLNLLGLWISITAMAALYLIALLLLPGLPLMHRVLPAGGLVLILLFFLPGRPPLVHADPAKGETVLEVFEGSAATVAVVRVEGSLKIKVNNFYAVGGTKAKKWEEWQTHLPLLLHPEPRSVFFLGMGTGITAGGALSHPVERVVITEIAPEVVEAARKHFGPYVNGLFNDPRAEIVVEDGRNYLLGTKERFDVIVGDLFMPWKASTGNLYSKEHFRTVRETLTEGGIFAQWLPLYQMSRDEFGVIARTMIQEFPLVTMWRGDFFSRGPIVGLVGHKEGVAMDPDLLVKRIGRAGPDIHDLPIRHFIPEVGRFDPPEGRSLYPERFLVYYCGNLTLGRKLFDSYAVNRDDRPILEYLAPVSQRGEAAGSRSWFVGVDLIDFMSELIEAAPPDRDNYLERLTGKKEEYVHAGLSFHRFQVLEINGDHEAAAVELDRFRRIIMPGTYR